MAQINQNSISGITSITSPSGMNDFLTLYTSDTIEKVKVTTGGLNVSGVTTISNHFFLQKDGAYIDFKQTDGTQTGYIQSRTTDFRFNSYGARPVTFGTNDVERVRIASNGYVGIGTDNPTEILDIISGTNSQNLRIWSKGLSSNSTLFLRTGDSGGAFIKFGDNSDNDIGKIHYSNSTNSMRFTVNASERLHITSDGKIGINQTPTRELSLHSPNNNNALIHFTNDDTGETASDGILVGLNGNEDMIVNNQESGKGIYVYTHNGSSSGERLRIDSSGNVNIAGIVTATSVTQRQNKYYGVTTTERNALSPSEGDIVYNTTTNKHEFYTSSSAWASISATPPAFDNASGSLATFYSESRSTTTLSSQPTASGDAPITYSIAAGSLPSGMSINTSTGVISGTPNAVGSDTTSNFTVQASNLGGAVTRDYSITVKAPVTTNYSYTGSTVTWSKPSSDVKRVSFRMWGGAGTHGTCTSNSQHPGAGGKTEGVINVESHNTLYLQVGEAGKDTSSGPNGGWPNGGNGNISHQCKGSGGGGSSNIYNSSGTGSYTNIVAVAGGGGSVSHGNPNSNGGDGGGTNGGSSNRGGGGGTQNAGGAQGTTACGNAGNSGAGTRLQGGTAGTGSGCTNAAAGGGGGWWGGGAGGNSNSGNTYGGGGGGSGYFDTSLVSGGATKTYGESGWSADQPSGIAARASYGDNNRGGHGYITLIY